MSDNGEGTAFDNWYNGLVGFHINSERIRNDIGGIGDGIDSTSLEKWMKVCWNNALEASQECLPKEMQHTAALHPWWKIEKLKAKS
jgi:hypothetical protein